MKGVQKKMREIVLDTETTGLKPLDGDKIVEIGCIELINHLATGNTFHQYINPERDMPEGALAVHGLTLDFLKTYPRFAEISDTFIEFIGDARLIIHNAPFDMGFINAELGSLGRPLLSMDRCIDTVKVARKNLPFAQVSLDALCRRFKIDNSNRKLHGALLDAKLLAEVYLQLIGGQQPDFILSDKSEDTLKFSTNEHSKTQINREARPHEVNKDELAAHKNFINGLKNPIWLSGAKAGEI
jgi:DNA polymerase-3 subunit epsilon